MKKKILLTLMLSILMMTGLLAQSFTITFEGTSNRPTQIESYELSVGARPGAPTQVGFFKFRDVLWGQPAVYTSSIIFKKMSPITTNSVIKFDYRFVKEDNTTLPFVVGHNYLKASVSTNGFSWSEITAADGKINNGNHTNSATMASHTINIGAYAGQTNCRFKFEVSRHTTDPVSFFDIDNIFFGEGTPGDPEEPNDSPVEITPSALDFGIVNVPNNVSKTVIIKNVSTGNITMTNGTFTSGNANTTAAEFGWTVVSGSPTLAPGQSVGISVKLTPRSDGPKKATLLVSNSTGTPFNVELTANSDDLSISMADNITIDFEGSTAIPVEIKNLEGFTSPGVQNNTQGNTGNFLSGGILAPFGGGSGGTFNGYINFKPMRDITATSGLKFRYKFRTWVGDNVALQLAANHNYLVTQASTNNGVTWVALDQINSTNHTNSNVMAERIINIGAYANKTVIFRLQVNRKDESIAFDIDDIFFGEIPATPIATLTPTALNFAKVDLNSSVSKELAIKNTGGGILSIVEGNFVGADANEFEWVYVSGPTEIPAGQSLVVEVNFTPLTAGIKDATFVILSNLDEAINVPLTGEGYDPFIYLPLTLDFENTTVPDEIKYNNMGLTNNSAHNVGSGIFLTASLQSTSDNGYIQFRAMKDITDTSVITFDYQFLAMGFGPNGPLTLASNHNYFVAMVSTDGVNFTPIAGNDAKINSTNHTNSAIMANHTINIGAYAGQTTFFRFEVIPHSSQSYYFDIDNIKFENVYDITIPAGSGATDLIVLADKNVELQFMEPNSAGFTVDVSMIDFLPAIGTGLPETVDSFLPRYWVIDSSVPNPGTYNITFDLEGLTTDYNLVRFFKRANSSADWEDVVADLHAILTLAGSKVTISGLDSFSEFVPGIDSTLPVTLASFNAVQTNNNFAQINWVTASENNVLGYNIYRAETKEQNAAIRITPTMIEALNAAAGASYSYVDNEVEFEITYYYWLETNDFDGTSEMVGPVTVKINGDNEHGIEEVLLGNQLFANYPNPFNPSTSISFSIAEPQAVTIDVYNLKGQLVKRVFDKQVNEINVKHNVVWNGQDSNGRSVASGVYFTIMKAGNQRFTNKAVLMK